MRIQPPLKPKEEKNSVLVPHTHVWASVFSVFNAHFCNNHSFIHCVLLSAVRRPCHNVLSNNIISTCLPLCCNYFAYCTYEIQCLHQLSPFRTMSLYSMCKYIHRECISYKCMNTQTHTHYFCSVYTGLIWITLMYLNCASSTRNIQVSDRYSVSADTQYSMTQKKKTDWDIPINYIKKNIQIENSCFIL